MVMGFRNLNINIININSIITKYNLQLYSYLKKRKTLQQKFYLYYVFLHVHHFAKDLETHNWILITHFYDIPWRNSSLIYFILAFDIFHLWSIKNFIIKSRYTKKNNLFLQLLEDNILFQIPFV